MKKVMLLLAMAIMTFFASTNINAQSAEEIEIIDAIVASMKESCAAVQASSDGGFSRIDAERSGSDIVLKMYLAIPEFRFSMLSDQYRKEFCDSLADSFYKGLFEGNEEDGQYMVELFKTINTKIIIKMYDVDGDMISKTIDVATR